MTGIIPRSIMQKEMIHSTRRIEAHRQSPLTCLLFKMTRDPMGVSAENRITASAMFVRVPRVSMFSTAPADHPAQKFMRHDLVIRARLYVHVCACTCLRDARSEGVTSVWGGGS